MGSPKELIGKPEREFSPSQSDDDHEAVAQDVQRHKFTEECEIEAGMANKLEEALKIPISKSARILDVVARFKDFPWAQDTVMAAHQLEEVLIKFLWENLTIPGETLEWWKEIGELNHRALIELTQYDTYHEPGRDRTSQS